MNKKQELLQKCKKVYQDYYKQWNQDPIKAKKMIDDMPFQEQMAIYIGSRVK